MGIEYAAEDVTRLRRVDRCLANNGDYKVLRFESSPICGYGGKLPCTFQQQPIKVHDGIGISAVYPCTFAEPVETGKLVCRLTPKGLEISSASLEERTV